MGKGYAEGIGGRGAARRARARRQEEARIDAGRAAVYASTDDEPERHFIGWVGDVDPDELFASGAAWGIQVMRRKA